MRTSVEVTQHPIDLATLLEPSLANDSENGAQVVFAGTIRKHNRGRPVTGLSYDVFEPLALTLMQELIEEARTQWGQDLSILIRQRIGHLQVGEIGILIIVSSPHRDEAYLASRYLIEGIKHKIPIWKKEFYEDGESDWLEGHSLCGHEATL